MSGLDLELSNQTGSTFVDLASSATNFIQDYVFGLKSEPITCSHDLKYPNTDELHALAQPLEAKSTINERGSTMQDILSHLGQVMQTSVTKSSHPGHVAFINGGGILAGAIGAMLASALHVQTGLWAECPSMIALEESVLQWMASMLGYPSTSSQGIITSGGSTTLLTAMICARHRYLPVEQMEKGVMYITEQSNCSVHKSAKLLGLSKHQIRVISVNDDYRMNLEELVDTIEKDLSEGLKPFMIVGNAGTTDTGKIDDLAGINAIACKYDLWFHVDACYGGFFALTEKGKELLKGIELADSVSLDPHKSLFMPLGYGVLLVKEGSALREAMSRPGPSPYLSNIYHITNYCDLSMELSRPNRGLPLWFALKLHGVNAFRTALQEKLDLAKLMCEQISQIENVQVISEPELTTFTFRYCDPDTSQSTLNMLNKTLVSLINKQQVIFVNSTIIKQKNVIRICVMNHRTHMQDITNGVDAIRNAIQEVQLLARNKHGDVHARVDDAALTQHV